MDVEKVYAEIQKLPMLAGKIGKQDPATITWLQELYKTVYNDTIGALCKGCHLKAAHKLSSLTIQNLKAMLETKFKLKKTALIEYPYRSGQHMTNHNITDEKAVEHLTAHPQDVEHYEEYPKNADGNLDLSAYNKTDDKSKSKAKDKPAA